MTTLITNGTVVGPTGAIAADVLVDGERIAALVEPGSTALGADLAATADTVIDAAGQVRDPGRRRRPHPHGAARSAARSRPTRSRPAPRAAAWGGTTTIIDFAVQRTGERVQDGLAAWHAKADGQVRDRLRRSTRSSADVDDELAEGDGRARRRGRHQLQAVHGLPGRLLLRRRPDPAGACRPPPTTAR